MAIILFMIVPSKVLAEVSSAKPAPIYVGKKFEFPVDTVDVTP